MWIMVGGPYGTGAKSAAERAANLARMNEAALAVWRKIIGVNLAHPFPHKGEGASYFMGCFRDFDSRDQANALSSNTTSVALLSKR